MPLSDAVIRLLDDLYTRFDQHLDAFNLWKVSTLMLVSSWYALWCIVSASYISACQVDTIGDAFIVISGVKEARAVASTPARDVSANAQVARSHVPNVSASAIVTPVPSSKPKASVKRDAPATAASDKEELREPIPSIGCIGQPTNTNLRRPPSLPGLASTHRLLSLNVAPPRLLCHPPELPRTVEPRVNPESDTSLLVAAAAILRTGPSTVVSRAADPVVDHSVACLVPSADLDIADIAHHTQSSRFSETNGGDGDIE
jgi:hypothetical protein